MKNNRSDDTGSKTSRRYETLVAIYFHLDKNIDFENLILNKGDITFDNKLQIEVKHYTGNKTMGNFHKHFWNTLYILKTI